MDSRYVSLHSHSIYSQLDGLSKVSEIVERAIELNSPAVCITDHGFATSHYEMGELCLKNNIKPIFGVEGYLAPKENTLKEKVEGFKSYYHLTLLAMNETGYKNLMILIADSFLNGKYIKPRFEMNKLERYSDGIICLSACLGGVLSQMLLDDRDDEAESWALQFKEIYGENFYIELTWTGLEQQDYVNEKLIALAEKINVEIVITPDSHYTRMEDSDYHKAMVCININKPFVPTGKEKDGDDVDEGSMFYTPGQYYIKSREVLTNEYYNKFKDCDKYFNNTLLIAEKIEWIKFNKEKKFPCDYKDPDKELMNRLVFEINSKIESGILSVEHKDLYIERVKEELRVIIQMGFSDYFIAIQDIVKWSNEKGISTGPGRGCFHEDAPIWINGGLKKIKDVIPGDMVNSSDLSKRTVIANLRYEIEEELICITYKHFDNIFYRIFSTLDHKHLVSLKGRELSPFFLEASSIDPIDHVLVGNNGSYSNLNYYPIEIFNSYSVIKDKYVVHDLMVDGNNTFMIGEHYVHNSGAGSFINFLLNVTRVNPLNYNLLFARMLNSGRSAVPQIEDILYAEV